LTDNRFQDDGIKRREAGANSGDGRHRSFVFVDLVYNVNLKYDGGINAGQSTIWQPLLEHSVSQASNPNQTCIVFPAISPRRLRA
jgi:hypothetical protein